jgi:hypothetical protein
MIRPQTREQLVQVGSKHDGGYFLPKDFTKTDSLISAGIGTNMDFERDLASYLHHGHLFDASIEQPSLLPKNFIFHKKHIGSFSSGEVVALKDIIRRTAGQIILKLDVEGSEYQVLDSLENSDLDRCPIIVCEFHNMRQRLGEKNTLFRVFEKILESHQIVWTGANNASHFYFLQGRRYPNVFECVFVKKSWCHNNYEGPNKTHVNHPELKAFAMPLESNQCPSKRKTIVSL